MKNIVLVITLIAAGLCSSASVSDSTKKASAKNFGFHFGLNYSNLRLKSSPYFLNHTSELGKVSVLNGAGVCGGFFLKFKNIPLRVALDINVLPSQLEYDNKSRNKEERFIYPLTVELPLSYTFDPGKDNPKIPNIIAGPRAVFPIPMFDDLNPVLQPFNINIDLGIGYPFKLPSNDMSVELIYSFGLLNLIDKEADGYQNVSVQSLYRDVIMLRCYFN